MHFVFAFGEHQLPVPRAPCADVLISLRSDSIYRAASEPGQRRSVAAHRAVIYNNSFGGVHEADTH